MPEVQNTLTKYTNKQSCSNPNAIIHSGQGAMEIHVSCACMFEGSVMPWVQTGLFSPQGKYTRKYWCYRIIYRVVVAKEINCILRWALPVCTGTHLRTVSLQLLCAGTTQPLLSGTSKIAKKLVTVQELCNNTESNFNNLLQHPGDCPVGGSMTLEQNNFSYIYILLHQGWFWLPYSSATHNILHHSHAFPARTVGPPWG